MEDTNREQPRSMEDYRKIFASHFSTIIAALVTLPAAYPVGLNLYREYTREQNRKKIDKLPPSRIADEIRIFQSGTAYSVERKKENSLRYPVDYVKVDYSPIEGMVFAEFTRYGTGMRGVSLVDRNADGFVDLEISLWRSIISNDDEATCFGDLSECNDPKLKDRITRRTRQSPEFASAQAQYETGLRGFLKERYTK